MSFGVSNRGGGLPTKFLDKHPGFLKAFRKGKFDGRDPVNAEEIITGATHDSIAAFAKKVEARRASESDDNPGDDPVHR